MLLRGVISEAEGEFVVIGVNAFKIFNNWFEVYGKINARGREYEQLSYGDRIEFEALLKKTFRPDPRIAAIAQHIKIIHREKSDNFSLYALLAQSKSFLIARLSSVLPEVESQLVAGLLLGSRSSIPQDILDDFRKTGLSHILAISGYNIVILINFVLLSASYLSRKYFTLITLFIIVCFTLLVGASASVVRAAIMGSLSLVARFFGRSSKGLRLLFVTAALMVFFDPFILIYDIGFQLSFAATAGIMIFSQRMKNLLEHIPNWLNIRDHAITTWAAQAFTLPLLFFYFKGFSMVTTIANILILPFVPLVMVGGALSLIIGKIAAAPTALLVRLMLAIIHFLATLPFSFIEVGIS